MSLDFDTDVGIDPDSLDIEWLRQATLYMRYATEAARRDAIVKRAKESLEVADAQIDREVRRSADKRLTEAQVSAAVTLDARHQQAAEELTEALYQYNIVAAAVRAMDNKRSALENLVKLYAGSYFAGPREPRNLSEEYGKRRFQEISEQRTRSTQRDSLNHRRDREQH